MARDSMEIGSGNTTTHAANRSKCRPRFQKRYLYLIAALVAVAALLIIVQVVQQQQEEQRLRRPLSEEGVVSPDGLLVPPDPMQQLPSSPSVLHAFRKAAVCTDGPPCSEIGRDILSRGGSAVDAALASMLCNGIVNQQSMGLGGGFLMTVYTRRTREAVTLNAREVAPRRAHREMFEGEEAKRKGWSAHKGPLSIAVPGELRGYWEAHKRFGVLPWREIVEPVVKLCETGYNMSRAQWSALEANPGVKDDETISGMFVDPLTGNFIKPGSFIKPAPVLCDTLRAIARDGGDILSTGPLADKLAEDLKRMGSIITKEDLADFKPKWAPALNFNLRVGRDPLSLYTAPPPGSGVLLGFIFNILRGYELSRKDIADTDSRILTMHRIVEAFKHTYARRTRLGDADYVDIKELLSNLTSVEYAEAVRCTIDDAKTVQDPAQYYGDDEIERFEDGYEEVQEEGDEKKKNNNSVRDDENTDRERSAGAGGRSGRSAGGTAPRTRRLRYYGPGPDDHGTAHISVLAPNGDAVSVTSTINFYFGSGLASPQTGIILNNCMDDFSTPGLINYFGVPPSPANFIAPGKRPLSSMSPSVITDQEGEVRMVVGASGGTKITTAVALVMLRHLWFDQTIKQAVDAPRFHHQLYPMQISYEYGILDQLIKGLQAKGHKTLRYRNRGSIICAMSVNSTGIYANADYRKGGDVYGL